MSAEFDYGNARLRARRSQLFDSAAYDALLREDLSGLLTALSATPYAPELQRAAARYRGLPCLLHTLRLHLGRALREMREFYGGRGRQGVDTLLGRWELRNVLTILRGSAGGAAPEEVLSQLVPVGSLDEGALRELARQPDLRATVDVLVAWGLPSREVARALLHAWPAFQRGGNLAHLEHALLATYTRNLSQTLRRGDAQDDILRQVLLLEVDQLNVLTALRLRAGRSQGEAVPDWIEREEELLLPGGGVSVEALGAAIRARSREDAAGRLREESSGSRWEALTRWVANGDLRALARGLSNALTQLAVSLWSVGDPLSIAVPVAFSWAKENECTNLRLVGSRGTLGLEPSLLRERLLLVR